MAEQARWGSIAETHPNSALRAVLANRASGPDQQPTADQQHKLHRKHLEESDVEPDRGPDEHQREHTSELSPAERTRSPRRSGDGLAHEKQQPWTINLGKDLSKSKTDQDGTACCYHAPDASPGPPAPRTPFGGPDPALTPESMFPQPGWKKDGLRKG